MADESNLIRVYPHIIDQHLRRKWRAGVRTSRPIASDGEVENDEAALPRVKRPRGTGNASEAGGIGVGDVGLRGIVHVVGHGSWTPDHAIGVPPTCCLTCGEVIDRAQTCAACKASSMH